MFSTLANIFDKRFVLGFWLPATGFIFAINYQSSPTIGLKKLIEDLSNLPSITLFLITSWFTAIFLMALNREIFRILEGYGLLNPFSVAKCCQIRAFKKLTEKQQELEQKILDSEHKIPKEKIQRELDLVSRRLAHHFPEKQDWILPTAFGNTVRAFETYPASMYGADTISTWNHLRPFVSKELLEEINEEKSHVDMWVNLTILPILLCIIYVYQTAITTISNESETNFISYIDKFCIPYILILILVSWLSSRRSISAARSWGDSVKAAFDIYLPELYKHLNPTGKRKRSHERFWRDFSTAVSFRRKDKL